MKYTPFAGALFALASASAVGRADGTSVRLDRVKPGELRIDGIPREWPTMMTPLARTLRGAGLGSARGAIAYDDASLYVAFEVDDDRIVRTPACGDADDHAALAIAFPDASGGWTAHEIAIVPGDPGKLAGCVKDRGSLVAGARVVEAPRSGGLTFEAQIPWAAFPEAARVRVGLRGLLRWHDVDGGAAKVVATSNDARPADWPRLPTEAEQAIDDGIAREKRLVAAPREDRVADVAGDAMLERVIVWDRWLIVAGPHFRGGREYWYGDVAIDPARPLALFDVRPGAGGGATIALRGAGEARTRLYAWDGETFAASFEDPPPAPSASAPPPAPVAAVAKEPEGPRPPTADELQDQVYALYRRERRADGKPRFDFVVDVAEDARPERVVVHGREVAVLGKGYRGGAAYAFATLPVTDARDVLDVTARDLTGDGKAEIVARVVGRATAPPDLGAGTLDRELLLVYAVGAQGPTRIFAAEIARSLGERRIQDTFRFLPVGRGADLEIAPARATGWTQSTWPFAGEPPGSGVEPLILPWAGAKPVRWRWDGSAFRAK